MPLRIFSAIAPAVAALLIGLPQAGADEITPLLKRQFANTQLLFCFQGKGSCLPYDAGILHEAYARIPALRENRVIIAGNSSGSIAAAFFSCYGFTDDNVAYAEERMRNGDRTAVRDMENPRSKFVKMLRGQRTEIGHEHLREYMGFALGVPDWKNYPTIEAVAARSQAVPRFPLLIVSCNKEVLEDADDADGRSSARFKEIDPATMIVSWRPEVYEFYKRHPERFAADHPKLKLGPDRRIGRAVTFFVDRSMYALLSQLPPEERLADLRLVKTAAEVALAIKASVSEPSYFDPVPEPDTSRVLCGTQIGDLGNVHSRTYYGGYIMALPAQDVRRMLPGIRTFGTGFRHFDLLARSAVSDWLLADTEQVAQRFEWWADLETCPDAEFESHMDHRDLTGDQEFEFGRRRARECFDADRGLPTFVVPPALGSPAKNAIYPVFDAPEMFVKAAGEKPSGNAKAKGGGASPQRLKSGRGLGPLLLHGADNSR